MNEISSTAQFIGERVRRFLMYCNCNLGIRIEISHCEVAKGNETQKWPKE